MNTMTRTGTTPAPVSAWRQALRPYGAELVAELRRDLVETARAGLPRPGQAALNARQHRLLAEAEVALAGHGGIHVCLER